MEGRGARIRTGGLLLTADRTPKVADFGIVRAAEFMTMTAMGAVVGSPQYMSPEQAKGVRVDIRSDLYSLGIIFFKVLTGHTPLEDQEEQGHRAGLDVRTEALEALDLPPGASALARRLVATNPNDRYQTPPQRDKTSKSLT